MPEQFRDDTERLDQKGLLKLLSRIADESPDDYVSSLQNIGKVSSDAATYYGGTGSVSLKDFQLSPELKKMRDKHKIYVDSITQNPNLSDTQKRDAIVKFMLPEMKKVQDVISGMDPKTNSLIMQLKTGARGKPSQIMQLLYGDMMVVDSQGKPIPIAGLTGYGEGAGTKEYWAGSYGSRMGYAAVQFGTADSGYFGKLLTQGAHRVVVTEKDCGTDNGIKVSGDDPHNIGAVLIRPAAGFEAGHVIEKGDIKKLKGKDIYTRSTMTCQADDGICSKCSGHRENGDFPPVGTAVGVTAARAVAEPTIQMALCLAEDTAVRMADYSVKKIQDIKKGDKVLGADEGGSTYPVNVVDTFTNGSKRVYKTIYRYSTSTKHTIELYSTLDHKVLQMTHKSNCGGEKYNGIPRILPAGEPGAWIMSVLPETFDDSTGSYKEEPFALLAGLLLGDGCYTDSVNSVNFSCADDSLIEELIDYMDNLGLFFTQLKGHDGIYYKVSSDSTGGSRDNRTGRYLKEGYTNPARKWLADHSMLRKYAYEKEIPTEAYSWSNKSIAELIGGLFISDGSVYKSKSSNRNYFAFGSTSLKLAEQVHELLRWRFGIYGTQIHKNYNKSQRKRALHTFTVSKEDSIMKFKRYIPLYGIKRLKKEAVESPITKQNANLRYNRCRRLSQEYIGELPTYDIQVDSASHLFVLANGLIVSNSSKHSGGVAGQDDKKLSGFKEISQFVNVPKNFQGGATLSQHAGNVSDIKPAPQGGTYVTVNREQHYIPQGVKISVKAGQKVEAGDVLSEGIPNPAEVVQFKGIGEGRRYFAEKYTQMLQDNGAGNHRRNVEALSRGLINRVKINKPEGYGGYYVDDVVPYDALVREYAPRKGFRVKTPIASKGMYMEKPALHYTIGTKITGNVAKDLSNAGIKSIVVHGEAPPFEPVMTRIMDLPGTDPDWKVRLGGFNLKKSFLDAATQGSVSKTGDTSYIPSVIEGKKIYSDYTQNGS